MSNIQWTDESSNPIHLIKPGRSHGGHWCRKISSECDNCYAESLNNSGFFSFASHLKYQGEVPKNLVFDEEVCKEWLKWRKPRKIFVCSMTDLFGEWVLDEWIDKIFGYMSTAHWHTFQILTKRPERAIAYFKRPDLGQRIMEAGELACKPELPLKNVCFGVTCGTQKTADKRIPLLLQIPAVVRWLSVEPLLGHIDLTFTNYVDNWNNAGDKGCHKVDWVVVGGESGKGARPCHVGWIESIVSQCQSESIPVFVKQLGNFPVTNNPEKLAKEKAIAGMSYFANTELITRRDYPDRCFDEAQKMGLELEGMYRIRLKDRKGGDINEFPKHLQIQEFPSTVQKYLEL